MKSIERLWTKVFKKIGLTVYMDKLVGKGVHVKSCVFGVTYYKNTVFGGFTIDIFLGVVKLVFYYWKPETESWGKQK